MKSILAAEVSMKRNIHDEVYWTEEQQKTHLSGVHSNDLLYCPFCGLLVEPMEETVCDLTIRCRPCRLNMDEPNHPKGKKRLIGRWNRRAI